MLHRFQFFALLSVVASLGNAQNAPRVVTGDPVEISERRWVQESAEQSGFELRGTRGESSSPAGIAAEAANFYVGRSGGRSFTDTFALRGLSNTPLFGDPAVSLYLDDMPLGSSFTFPSELFGFDRAELYRGPGQSTHFGRVGTAGVLRYSTPTVTSGEDEVHARWGNFAAREADVRTSRQEGASDVFAAASYSARDGYITNTRLHRPIDGRESEAALLHLRSGYVNTGQWSVLITGERVRDGVQPLVPLNGPYYSVDRSAEGVTHLETLGASVRGAFATAAGTVSTTTSYDDWKLGPATNVLNFGFAELQNASELRQRTWSEELSWVSEAAAPVQGKAGVFASESKTDGDFTRAFSGAVFERSDYRTDHESLAGFGEFEWKAAPSLALTPGVRIEANKKKIDRREHVPAVDRYLRSNYSAAFLPKLEARYDLDARTYLTAEAASSYKPGGFSAFTGNRALAAFGPERVAGLDAAFARRSADGRFVATVRGFAYRVRGYQIERSFRTGAQADDYLVVNAAHARSLGGEAELAWAIAKGLTAEGSFGLTNVTLRDFHDPYTGVNYTGKRAPYAPTYNAHLGMTYRHGSGFFAQVESTAVGRTFYTEGEAPLFSQGAYLLLGGKLGYQKNKYMAAIYGDNLTDRAYYSSITPGTLHGTPGAPRTYGIEASVRF